MGFDALNCDHGKVIPSYEDDILLGRIWAGNHCTSCYKEILTPHPGDAIKRGVYK